MLFSAQRFKVRVDGFGNKRAISGNHSDPFERPILSYSFFEDGGPTMRVVLSGGADD